MRGRLSLGQFDCHQIQRPRLAEIFENIVRRMQCPVSRPKSSNPACSIGADSRDAAPTVLDGVSKTKKINLRQSGFLLLEVDDLQVSELSLQVLRYEPSMTMFRACLTAE